MESRRTRQHPFQTTPNILSIFSCPRVVCTLRSVSKCQVYDVEEVYKTQPTQIRTIRALNIPSLEGIRKILVASWHSCQTLEVLREEGEVYTDEKQNEVCHSMVLRILTSSLFTYPEIECSKDSKNCPHAQYIVEMCNYVVSHSLSCVTTEFGLSLLKMLELNLS